MTDSTEKQPFVLGLWGVQYQVRDVARSIAFYAGNLGFNLDRENLPAFGQVSIGDMKLILSGPGNHESQALNNRCDGHRADVVFVAALLLLLGHFC